MLTLISRLVRVVQTANELQSKQAKRTPQDHITELIIWITETASRFENAVMNWLFEYWTR